MRHIASWRAPLTVAVLTCTAGAAIAVCDTPEACLRAIEVSQRATQTLSARFQQTKRLSLLNEPLVSMGRFAFKQPDQVLWQMDEPRVTVRIDRQGIHLPDVPQAEQADLAPFSKVLRELAGVFTGSWSSMRTNFEVTVHPGAESVRVHLVPRDAEWQRMFRSMALSFSQPGLILQAIRLEESLGDSVEIVFRDVHRNDAVAAGAIDVTH